MAKSRLNGENIGLLLAAFVLVPALAVVLTTGTAAAPMMGNKSVVLICEGPLASTAQAIVAKGQLPVGSSPDACFGQADIYHMPAKEIFAIEPSTACPRSKAIDAYSQSMVGSWFALFPAPVCGSDIQLGPPQDARGIKTIVIDGLRYGGGAAGDYKPLR